MGLDKNAMSFLSWAAQTVSFDRTATLGRQGIYASGHELLPTFGPAATKLLTAGGGFCEPFLTWLGAREVVSVDASDYEGASIIADLNEPLPDDLGLAGRFSAVIDGGTLEHVFDQATALRNAARMVALDGHFLAIAPVNSLAGHGFYQFSPELYFRTFSEAWGFTMERVLIARVGGRRWFEVVDPAVLGRRIAFSTPYPAFVYVCARRTSIQTDLTAPQQSDYVLEWSGLGRSGPRVATWRRLVPARGKQVMRAALSFCPRRLDRVAFKRVRLSPSGPPR